jgi:hypothetical protein
MGSLTLARSRQCIDCLSHYQFLLDGRPLTTLRAGRTIEVKLPPGRHQLVVKMGWFRTAPLEIEAIEGLGYRLEAGSNVSGWKLLLILAYVTVLRHQFLYLREALGPTAPLSRDKVSVRSLMILVGLVGILLGVGIPALRAVRNRPAYEARAAYHIDMETIGLEAQAKFDESIASTQAMAEWYATGPISAAEFAEEIAIERRQIDSIKRCTEYHTRMKVKYQAASRRPWLDVGPDPPEPEMFPLASPMAGEETRGGKGVKAAL